MIGPVGTAYAPYRTGGVAPSTYRSENGTYRSEISTNSGGGGGGMMGAFGVPTELNGASVTRELGGQPKEWNLDFNDGWDEKMDISPLSPTPGAASLAGERPRVDSMRVDGMRFEMVGEMKRFEMPGDETFKPNEKPLGRRGGLGENLPNI
jgi:hypothetical protein